jgi:hypothetical protein
MSIAIDRLPTRSHRWVTMCMGEGTMKLSIADYRRAIDIIHDPSSAEAAIVSQFARDLAVTARFGTVEPPLQGNSCTSESLGTEHRFMPPESPFTNALSSTSSEEQSCTTGL